MDYHHGNPVMVSVPPHTTDYIPYGVNVIGNAGNCSSNEDVKLNDPSMYSEGDDLLQDQSTLCGEEKDVGGSTDGSCIPYGSEEGKILNDAESESLLGKSAHNASDEDCPKPPLDPGFDMYDSGPEGVVGSDQANTSTGENMDKLSEFDSAAEESCDCDCPCEDVGKQKPAETLPSVHSVPNFLPTSGSQPPPVPQKPARYSINNDLLCYSGQAYEYTSPQEQCFEPSDEARSPDEPPPIPRRPVRYSVNDELLMCSAAASPEPSCKPQDKPLRYSTGSSCPTPSVFLDVPDVCDSASNRKSL